MFDLINLPITDKQAKEMLQGAPNENESIGKLLFYLYMCFREQGMLVANAYLAVVKEHTDASSPTIAEAT